MNKVQWYNGLEPIGISILKHYLMNNCLEILTRYHDLAKMIETQFSIVTKMILRWISYYSRQVVFKLLVHILCYILIYGHCMYVLLFVTLLETVTVNF